MNQHVAAGRRLLLGFDFPYGYPAGLAAVLGIAGPEKPWLRIWQMLSQLIRDDDANRSNRFEVASQLNERIGGQPGPFWNCPTSAATASLRPNRSAFPHRCPAATLEEFRVVERRLHAQGRRIHASWKLFTSGSVGSQALVGIPRIHALRFDPMFASISRVWPFETGFTSRPSPQVGPFILHVEIWPGAMDVDLTLHHVKDAAQVLSLVRGSLQEDALGNLRNLFSTPPDMSAEDIRRCVDDEGFILGVV